MNIKNFRKALKITQEELASYVGIHENTIRLWEKNVNEPRSSDIKKLCEIFNCTEAELFNDTDNDQIKITISSNWEEFKKGDINMNDNKFKLILGEDGVIGLHGAGKITSHDAINDFLGDVKNQLEIALDAQIKRGAIQEA